MNHTGPPLWHLQGKGIQGFRDAEPVTPASREDAHALVGTHFPSSTHDEVPEAVGIESELELSCRKRGSNEKVLSAYRHQCTACSFGVRLDDRPVALEAVHLK